MRTGASGVFSEEIRDQARPDVRLRKTRKSRLRRNALEYLESRTLLATIPAAQYAANAAVSLPGGGGNDSASQVAVDRYNPQHLVSVWVRTDPNLAPANITVVEGAFSTNGGQSWTSFSPTVGPQLDAAVAPPTTGPPTFYTQTINPLVGFDASHNFYVLTQQTNGGNTSGALILTKFNFSGGAPAQQSFVNPASGGTRSFNIVNQYTSDPIVYPTMTIDDNVASYTDPSTGAVQADPSSNAVWIGWTTNSAIPQGFTPANQWNPNRVLVTASTDGGQNFSASVAVSDNTNFSTHREATPRIAISQGTPGGAAGGQATIIWTDMDVTSTASPPFNVIQSSTVTGPVVVAAAGQGGLTNPAVDPGNNQPFQPQTTSFPLQVSVTAPGFSLSNLSVTLNMFQAALGEISATLVAPNGVASARLFSNNVDASGTTINGGLTGANLGRSASTQFIGTTFNDNAPRGITAGTAPYVGTFQAQDSLLDAFSGLSASQLSGTWHLVITTFRNTAPGQGVPANQVVNWNLKLNSGMVDGVDRTVATTQVVSPVPSANPFPTYSRTSAAAGAAGIGPGLQIAQDNTLGSFSAHQNRLYVVYVDYQNITVGSGAGVKNPADNTDIFLVTSDDGGLTWSSPTVVNDDLGQKDGHTEASNAGGGDQQSGRPQFLPSVAVDQATGTLVVAFRDSRDDASRARSAVYVTASTDGGTSFNQQIYANNAQTATDAITGATVTLAPETDNLAGLTPATAFGFGSAPGLAVFGGTIVPVWAANFNIATWNGTAVVGNPLHTVARPLHIAAGPRIVDSTMGPVAAPATSFTVTFDRPVDPLSFTKDDAQVYFHDTINGDAFVQLPVTAVQPITQGADGATVFRITFDSSGLSNPTGTYSYLIRPEIADRIRIANTDGTTKSLGNMMDQNADGTAGSDPITAPFNGRTPGDVYAAPYPTPKNAITFTSALSILTPPFDQTTLPLIVSGPQVVSTSTGSNGNLVLNGTNSTVTVTFDRPVKVYDPSNPLHGFSPDKVLQIMGPTGSVIGPKTFPSSPSTANVDIPDATSGGPGTLTQSITIPNSGGTFRIADMAVVLNITHARLSDLSASLIAPDGVTTIPLFLAGGLSGSNLSGTTFSESSSLNVSQGSAPYSGVFRPSGSFSVLDGKVADGTWKLVVSDNVVGVTGKLLNWSLVLTPGVEVAPINASGGFATAFTVTFPVQELGGTYAIQLSPDIFDQKGQGLDTNRNAGLDVLRGEAQNVPTAGVNYGSGNVALTIPSATSGGSSTTPGTVSSTINIPDNFLIQGQTASGQSGIQVSFNIAYANDPDLTATLYYHKGQSDEVSVTLFSGVGGGPNTANFSNTTLDDNSRTPIQQANAPFFGTFNPQQSLLTAFQGLTSGGAWTLVVSSSSTSLTGKLNSWSLSFQKPLPTSGLGEPVADRVSASFRIFTMDPTNPLSHTTWTAVGPAAISDRSGRIGGLAMDPSDPTGNTVYVGGASGGIWKTTNFLTTDPAGPTYVPLTSFGPTNAVNIGGIAVFGRNNDPNQSIVVAATGEGDTQSPGVGFLISKDGGATWALYDSTTNVDASGNLLPYNSASRDRAFVGTTSFKVVVDPTLTPTGNVIIYAALSGGNGGIWRSIDTGAHWTLMRAGQATDVVLDPASATGVADGNLQILYGAFRGDGVYLSPNRGQVWNQMTGQQGNGLIFNTVNNQNVNPATKPSPNGAQGRIVLAKPALTGNRAQDRLYEGWLYAAVSNPDGTFNGLYQTKDYGANWTQVRIPTLPAVPGAGGQHVQAVPSNDVSLNDYPILGGAPGGLPAQGNYNITMAVDPNNPNIVYLGGAQHGDTGLIRIDATNIWDAHNLTATSAVAKDGALSLNSTGAVTITDPKFSLPPSFINLISNPSSPFLTQSTVRVNNASAFTNNGFGVEWIPFDLGGTDAHRAYTFVDPLTGLTRLVIGDDQGVFSGLDDNGTYVSRIGNVSMPGVNRNGNIQITQFYFGAIQPSFVAAANANALIFGSAQDDGGPASDGDLLNNGNLTWSGPGGDAGGVATDQQGSGTLLQYWWPCCGGDITNFFQVNGDGRTTGLIQQANGGNTPDPQWPFLGTINFAVNPINSSQILISSGTGRVFSTETQGVTWNEIGAPSVFGASSPSMALAYGAPDPNAPGGIGNLGNFLYVGTAGGKIFVSQTGGGTLGSGNAWTDISNGLDGSAVQRIVTNPNRGSHEAYAITSRGVYYLADSIPSASNTPTWTNITGNLFNLAFPIFGQTYDPSTVSTNPYTLAASLTALVADWRYAIPDDPTNPSGPVHPVLYASANSGVYRSIDKGVTWTFFPDQSLDGSSADGGYLPHANFSDLDVALGNIDPSTGRPNLAGPYDPTNPTGNADPDLLLATSYGNGSFGIRLAPLVFPGTVAVDPSNVNGTAADGTPIVTTATPTIDGLSAITGFGNATRITIVDVTDPANPRIIGGFDKDNAAATNKAASWTDASGNFKITTNSGEAGFQTNGLKTIKVFATDDAGAVGDQLTLSFTLSAKNLPPTSPPSQATLAITSKTVSLGGTVFATLPLSFGGNTDTNVTSVQLLKLVGGVPTPFSPALVTTVVDPTTGAFSFAGLTGATFPDGTYQLIARATNAKGSTDSTPITFTVKTNGPTQDPTLGLLAADDSGIVGDNITNVRIPVFAGTVGAANANTIIQLYKWDAVAKKPTGSVLATATADGSGNFSIHLPTALVDGAITVVATAVDALGNKGPGTNYQPVTVTVVTVGSDYGGNPIDAGLATTANPAQSQAALFVRGTDGKGTWFALPSSPSNVPIWFTTGKAIGTSTDIPLQADYDGDGKVDLIAYNRATALWTINESFTGSTLSFTLGTAGGSASAGSIPFVGNFDGPGASQIGVYDVVTTASGRVGQWTILNANGTRSTVQFGLEGDVPAVGDYDGTGRDQLAVFRPSTGQFFVYQGAGNQVETITIPGISPSSSLIPVPGQYDNTVSSHRTEAAVFDQATGLFAILGPSGVRTVAFQAGDVPVSADYLGNGSDQPAVYRPGTFQFLEKDPTDSSGNKDLVIATFNGLGTQTAVPPASPLFYLLNAATTGTGTGGGNNGGGNNGGGNNGGGNNGGGNNGGGNNGGGDNGGGNNGGGDNGGGNNGGGDNGGGNNGGGNNGGGTTAPTIATTVGFANGTASEVNGVIYVRPGVKPWLTGTAPVGSVVTLLLSGKGIKGQRIVATTTANAAGAFAFHVTKPRLVRGNYTFLVQSQGPSGTAIGGVGFKVGTPPRVRPAVTAHAAAQARPVVRLQALGSQAGPAAANAAVIDEAIGSVMRARNLFRKNGK
ncbi:Proprotein convertase P-domain protein (plasmid) [Aquisphaera giovannonii]|uniref:Proprotein convertase P-domain protein n=1 Tax=Aquisphaera giovannonii TaxID=406548 RepID=A0A5B9WGK4_9BACT|nr:proprotein convertase P-domain-containing protein [Aquisphaera giovannonii]QEH39304.1 Proprotein convertase P-domain protein [Aquisphaera giovannonii]